MELVYPFSLQITIFFHSLNICYVVKSLSGLKDY